MKIIFSYSPYHIAMFSSHLTWKHSHTQDILSTFKTQLKRLYLKARWFSFTKKEKKTLSCQPYSKYWLLESRQPLILALTYRLLTVRLFYHFIYLKIWIQQPKTNKTIIWNNSMYMDLCVIEWNVIAYQEEGAVLPKHLDLKFSAEAGRRRRQMVNMTLNIFIILRKAKQKSKSIQGNTGYRGWQQHPFYGGGQQVCRETAE